MAGETENGWKLLVTSCYLHPWVVFNGRTFLNSLKGPLMKPSDNMKNKIPSDTYWRVELVCTKVRSRSSLEPPLQYNHDQMPLTYQDSLWPFLTILGVTEILCSFRLVLEGKTCKEIYTWIIKIRILRKVFSKQFCFIGCRRQHFLAVQ